MTKTYKVFGLTIASDFVLEALAETELLHASARDHDPDVTVARVTGLNAGGPHPVDPFFDIRPDVQLFYWSQVGTFVIESPARVLVEPIDGASDYLVSQPLLGLVISVLLERRNLLSLHASAVCINGAAAIFLGDKGAGKSTTFAALVGKGYLPITDDLVAVNVAEGRKPMVRPGFARMKLWPDSIAALGLHEEEDDIAVHPTVSKIQKSVQSPVMRDDVRFGASFVLQRNDAVRKVEAVPLPPHEALHMAMRFSFMARYGETKLGPRHTAEHIKRCSSVVTHVPFYALRIPADLTGLNALVENIAEIMG
ncbi:MAG: hypothetical protein AB8B58_01680 [Roseobacter sp.]